MANKQNLLPEDSGRIYEKDVVGTPLNSGLLYDNGPWSLVVGEVMSEVVSGGSALQRWLPTRGVIHENEHVAHLSWVAPDGFDGTQSYMDYLSGLDPIGECEFGPTTDWNGFEYRHEMYRVSFKSETITRRHFGLKKFEEQPIVRMRGPNAGLTLENDGDWALARVAYQLEHHQDWNIIYGDPAAGQLMYHGLDNIIEPGWVASRAIGGSPVGFSDPIVMSAVGVSDPAAIVRMIRGMVRRARTRAFQRGYRLTTNDYAIVLSSAHWNALADHIAAVGTTVITGGVTLATTVEAFQRERNRLMQGGLGFGNIDVDGQPVPVIIEDLLATNVTVTTDDGPASAVTGDIYLLTRYFGGQTILEHQFLDWSRLPLPQGLQTNEFIRQNGMVRAGWVVEANSCFYYYVDMWGRIISRYQPLQGKIKDVTLVTLLENENESMSFASPDYIAFGPGNQGGAGNAYLIGRK